MKQNQEKDLIQRCKSGDRKAFDQLVIRYQERIFATAYRLLGNYEEARDTVQDAFIKAYQGIEGFREEANFYTWIYRIVMRLCYYKLRSKKYLQTLRTQSLDELRKTEEGYLPRQIAITKETPHQILIRKETQQAVRGVISTLTEKYYQVIVLRDLENLSYKKIAKILSCPVGTVRSRLAKARELLKRKLKKITI